MGHALPAGSWGGVVLPGSRETLTATHICGEAGAMLGTTRPSWRHISHARDPHTRSSSNLQLPQNLGHWPLRAC